MALNIKDPRTDELARELAALTGQPITQALREAIEQRLETLRAAGRTAAPGLEGIIARGRGRPVIDDRPAEEILGYDDRGLPS
ncbi:type II toxin-antitoxin system VapB family antitoxin [Patulibacter sp. NPDC049589]|uniref:type II toxin-antitoxin system VapB family antitoxin n=1 Tax=Patulibacter sp. NPDC049589 TaxID=3154731 RepID=UPI003435C06D